MSVMGKILVVLNLVGALAVGGFFLFDFVKRKDWHQAHEKRVEELRVQAAALKTLRQTLIERTAEVKALNVQVTLAKGQSRDEIQKLEGEKIILQQEANRVKGNYDELQTNFKKVSGQKDLLVKEVDFRNTVIAEREKKIVALQDDRRKAEQDAQNQKRIAESFQLRNEALLSQNLDLRRLLAKKEAGVVAAGGNATAPIKPSAPPVSVKGVVQKVDAEDKSLVQINKGSDQGLAKNHVLVVYRLQPKAEYLGQMVILDVYANRAIGRLMRKGFSTARSELRAGDIVASSLQE